MVPFLGPFGGDWDHDFDHTAVEMVETIINYEKCILNLKIDLIECQHLEKIKTGAAATSP